MLCFEEIKPKDSRWRTPAHHPPEGTKTKNTPVTVVCKAQVLSVKKSMSALLDCLESEAFPRSGQPFSRAYVASLDCLESEGFPTSGQLFSRAYLDSLDCLENEPFPRSGQPFSRAYLDSLDCLENEPLP